MKPLANTLYPLERVQPYAGRIEVLLANGNFDAATRVVEEAARALPKDDDAIDVNWDEAWVAELERFGVLLEHINVLECSGFHLCSLVAEAEYSDIRRIPQFGVKGRRIVYDALIKAGFQPNWIPK